MYFFGFLCVVAKVFMIHKKNLTKCAYKLNIETQQFLYFWLNNFNHVLKFGIYKNKLVKL
jgi:hypothetical protein